MQIRYESRINQIYDHCNPFDESFCMSHDSRNSENLTYNYIHGIYMRPWVNRVSRNIRSINGCTTLTCVLYSTACVTIQPTFRPHHARNYKTMFRCENSLGVFTSYIVIKGSWCKAECLIYYPLRTESLRAGHTLMNISHLNVTLL